ncbi:MAG: mechanosensitive ion channel family protein [Janthinobacterium lividum]
MARRGPAAAPRGLGLQRYRTDVSDNQNARRLRTQVLVIRRLTVALVVLVAAGAALLTFPGVRAVGASLLASAGLVSVVVGVAAQSTLANVFAGIQLAFSDAIRIEDVVVVDGQWGRIDEITLSYVVVHLWDDRRLVLPSGWFTKEPFENWTRRSSELLGTVELDLDWHVDVDGLRTHLGEVLARTPLWDGRSQALQVTDAVGGLVRVRVLVSAVDASTLFDLRCHVRERLVAWARDRSTAMPRRRVELVPGVEAPVGVGPAS